MLIHAGARVFYENEDLACPTQLACKTALLKVLMHSDPKLRIPFGNLLGKNCTCQMSDVSHFDALKWLNFHMRILNMEHSETELLLVTRMASTFFSLTFLFQTIHSIMVLSSRLLEVRPRFAQR